MDQRQLETPVVRLQSHALSRSEHCLPWGWFPLKDRSRRHCCLLIIVRRQQIVKTRLVWRFSESRERHEDSSDTVTVAVSPPDCWCVSAIPMELVTSSPAATEGFSIQAASRIVTHETSYWKWSQPTQPLFPCYGFVRRVEFWGTLIAKIDMLD